MVWNFVLLTISFLDVIAFACLLCSPRTQKEAFDAADIVAHVTIIEDVANPGSYHMQYNEVFKQHRSSKDLRINSIIFSQPVSAPFKDLGCGFPDLKDGEEYLISGTVGNDFAVVGLCSGIPLSNDNPEFASGIILWSSVDEMMLEGLRRRFE